MYKKIIFFYIISFSVVFSQIGEYRDERILQINKQIASGNCKSALKDLKKLVKDEPEHARAYLKIGYCSIETKQYDNALVAFARAEEISSGIESRLGTQLVYLLKGDYDKSIEAGNKILEIDQFNYTARLRIMEAYIQLTNFSKAEKEITGISNIHGKSAELIWHTGRIRYLQGDTEEAFYQYENAYAIDPLHPATRASLGLPKNRFSLDIQPVYSHYHFSKNSIKSGGDRRGGYATLTILDKFTIGGGHTLDTVGNLSDTGGIYQTLINDVNVLNYALYGYTTPALIQTYYNLPINQYYNYTNLLAKDFRVYQSSGHISYAPNFKTKIKVAHHKIESNEVYTDGSAVTDISFMYGRSFQVGFAGTRILFPKHNGYQGTATIKFPIFKELISETNFIGETVNIQTYKYEILSTGTYYVRSYEDYDRTNLGAFQQSFTYSTQYFSLGGGGRAGNLYTPILADMPIINPSYLRSGAFGFISIHPFEGFQITVSNSRDYWKNAYGETLHSDQTKITGSIRF